MTTLHSQKTVCISITYIMLRTKYIFSHHLFQISYSSLKVYLKCSLHEICSNLWAKYKISYFLANRKKKNHKKPLKSNVTQSKISFFLIPRLPTCPFPRVSATIFSSTYLFPCMVILMYKFLYVFSCINPLPAFQYSRVYNFSFSPLYPLKLAHYQAHRGVHN